MRYHPSDNLLLVLTCIGLYISYRTILTTLQSTKDAAQSPSPPPTQTTPTKPARQLDPRAENEIDLTTLHTLSKSHNLEVRNAAIKILLDRVAPKTGSKALNGIIRDIGSLKPHRRERGVKAFKLLLHGVDKHDADGNASIRQIQLVLDGPIYYALVEALINLLPEHERWGKGKETIRGKGVPEGPPSPVRPVRRPYPEKMILEVLMFAIGRTGSLSGAIDENGEKFDALNTVLDAGLVERWLANYPFPCAMEEYSKKGNFRKSDVVGLFEGHDGYASDDPVMAGVMRLLMRSPRGMKELRKVGLTMRAFREDVKPVKRATSWGLEDDETGDVLMVGGEETAGLRRTWTEIENINTTMDALRPDGVTGLRPRSSDRSREVDRLRRRHREAIVVAHEGEPLSRENILQRQDSGTAMTPDALSDDDYLEHDTNMSNITDDSMPSLGGEIGEPIDRSQNESPQSFRRRVSERLRQGFTSFPTTDHGQSSSEDGLEGDGGAQESRSIVNGSADVADLVTNGRDEGESSDTNPYDVPD